MLTVAEKQGCSLPALLPIQPPNPAPSSGAEHLLRPPLPSLSPSPRSSPPAFHLTHPCVSASNASRHSLGTCLPSFQRSKLASKAGRQASDLYSPPHPVLQTNPLVSPPSLQQNICCGHTSHSAPPQPIDKHIFSSNLPSLQLIPLPQLPSPAGISWDSVGHTGQGRRQTNCRSSSLSPL